MLQFPIAMTPRTEPARALAWLSPVIAFALTVFTGFCLCLLYTSPSPRD